MNRVPTGIKGFDELVQGGFPERAAILLSGSPGTGKTIFGLEYVYKGAAEFGEKGMYISFEQNPEDLREQARQMGFDEIERLEYEGMLNFVCLPVSVIDKHTMPDLLENARELAVKRIVVDSLSAMAVNTPLLATKSDPVMKQVLEDAEHIAPLMAGEDLKKNFIYKFVAELKGLDATTILLSEIPEKSEWLSSDGISEFAVDGVILVSFESMGGDFSRSLIIRKMRLTKNDEDIHPVEISEDGLVVHTIE